MRFSQFIIIFFSCNLFAQSTLNWNMPESIQSSDARSMGMGNSYFSTGTTASVTSTNPARLSYLKQAFDLNLSGISCMERRSMIMLDGWGEFLANADYVFNQHTYYSFGFGYMRNFKMSDNSFIGFGVSHRPYKSFNYTYEQEVRSERDYPDGYIGIKDPVMGYQVYESNGTMNLTSIGLGYQFDQTSVGLSINRIDETSHRRETYIDTLYNTFDPFYDDNFDNFTQAKIDTTFDSELYFVISLENLINNESLFLFNYENGVDEHFMPEKVSLGFKIQPKDYTMMIIEMKKEKYVENYLSDDINRINIGFEYAPINGFPIRAGFEYVMRPIMLSNSYDLPDLSIFTIGTGRKFGSLSIDAALQYHTLDYYAYGQFVDPNSINSNTMPDKIIENNLSFLTTLKWSF